VSAEPDGTPKAGRRPKGSDSMARAACRALGYLGDSRALPVMMQLYRDGFTPSVVAEAWLGFGVLALDPIVDMIDADPTLAKRSALAAPLAHMPLDFVVSRLLARLTGPSPAQAQPTDGDDERVPNRAIAYLKLCTDHPKARIELARQLLDPSAWSATWGKTAAGKRLLTTARKLVPTG
jgi:HEAT repeat protein